MLGSTLKKRINLILSISSKISSSVSSIRFLFTFKWTASIATAVTDENGRTTWIDPDSPENIGVTLINKAMKHMTAGDYETALKELETDELVQRIQYNEMPLRVEYSLTGKGRDLLPVFYAISQWGMKYIP